MTPPPATASRGDLSTALIGVLRTVTSRPVGDNRAPDPADGKVAPDMPYAIVYDIEGGVSLAGPNQWENLHSDVAWPFQVTSVGLLPVQVRGMADKVRDAILGRGGGSYRNALASSTQVVVDRALRMAGPTTLDGSIYTIVDRFTLTVTPL